MYAISVKPRKSRLYLGLILGLHALGLALVALLMAAPMLVLYEISIYVAVAFGKKPAAKDDESEEKADDATNSDTADTKAAKAEHPTEDA